MGQDKKKNPMGTGMNTTATNKERLDSMRRWDEKDRSKNRIKKGADKDGS